MVDGSIDAIYSTGKLVYGLPGQAAAERLAGPVHTPFTAALAPGAIPDGDPPRAIAYNSFSEKRPVIRLHDLATNEDFILDEGAYSIAWRYDGAIAYFKGLEPRVRKPAEYLGHVVVRASPRASPQPWTEEPGRYVVAAWAEDKLLVHRQTDEWPDLLVFDGAGRMRVLAKEAALVALSPDGTQAFITVRPDPTPAVEVVSLDNGAELTRFAFPAGPSRGGQEVTYVADSGSWVGGRVVAGVSQGFAVFRIDGTRIGLEQLLRLDPEAFPLGATEPRLDESATRLFATVELQQRPRAALPRMGLLECDRINLRCEVTPPRPYLQPPRVLYNPSRP